MFAGNGGVSRKKFSGPSECTNHSSRDACRGDESKNNCRISLGDAAAGNSVTIRSGLWWRRSRSLLLWRCLGLFLWLLFRSIFRSFLRLFFRFYLGGCLRFDRNEFNIENESGIRADGRAGSAALTVCEIRRDIELPLGADGHKLNGFRPTLNDPANGNLQWFAALIGTIKFGIVHKGAAIVAEHSVFRCWLGTSAFLDDFVLKAAGEGNYTLLGLV